MSVDIPATSTDFVRQVTARAVRRAGDSRALWGYGLVILVAAYAWVLALAPPATTAGTLPWLLAPFLAVMAWTDAAHRAEHRARLAAWAFAAAALAGLIAQSAWAVETHLLEPRGAPFAAYFFLAPPALLAFGAWLALGSRRLAFTPAATADAFIVMLAGSVAVLRIVVEPVLISASAGGGTVALVASLQTLGLVPLALASLLLLRRVSLFQPAAASAIFAAALAFAAAGMLSLATLEPQHFSLRDPFDYLWLAGWLILAFAGTVARSAPSTAPDLLRERVAFDGVRRMIVPASAVFLAVGVVDVALRPPRPETVLALALLGGMIAFRTARAFALTDGEEDRKRQLAYARALVDVSHSLAEAPGLETTLTVICDAARSVLGARAAGIELISEDGEFLETRAAVGLSDRVIGIRYPVRESFTGWVVQHGEPRAATDPREDPYIQPQSLGFLGRAPVAAAPIRFRDHTTGALYACIRPEPFGAEELEFLGAMAEQAAIAIERARLFDQVTRLSVTDPLTGVANRRCLEAELGREFAAARRGRGLVVVLFDLDDFKRFNDTRGHLAGDAVLQAFARALRAETRAMNLAARYGGDEFVALLSGTEVPGARHFVERVRSRFTAEAPSLDGEPLTVSAGLAAFDPAMAGPDDLVRAADAALYRQKSRARV